MANDAYVFSLAINLGEIDHGSMRLVRTICLILSMVPLGPHTKAAEINVSQETTDSGGRMNVVLLTGEIQLRDGEKFEKAVADLTSNTTVIILDSPGGKMVDGLDIGTLVRLRGYDTAVPDGATCASMCALIWLAGRDRYVGGTARIGFHAVYLQNGDEPEVSGAGNALVGSYLGKLGLSDAAIFYITEPNPTEDLHWLNPRIARQIGIGYIQIPDPATASPRQAPPSLAMTNSPPIRSPPPAAVGPAPIGPAPIGPTPSVPVAPAAPAPDLTTDLATGTVLERQVMHLVIGYYALWSQGGPNIGALADYYAPDVRYFGSITTRQKIMAIKQSFAQRWPFRDFSIAKITASCSDTDTCTITGKLSWDARSEARNDHSVGAATFQFTVGVNSRVTPPLAFIVAESGTTLTVRKQPLHDGNPDSATSQSMTPASLTPDQQAGSVTPSFADGRKDRVTYETWYGGLPDGSYRDGATFWAAHRSDRPPPSCEQPAMPTDWRQGCADTQTRLATSDVRRRVDSEYWRGWNSL